MNKALYGLWLLLGMLLLILAQCKLPGGDVPDETVTPSTPDGLPVPPILPEGVSGNIVPLPEGDAQEQARETLEEKINASGLQTADFNTNRVAVSTDESLYIAPTNERFERFESEAIVGVLYDREGKYGYGELVYTVRFLEDQVILTNEQEDVQIEDDALFAQQEMSFEETQAFFVEGSCWGCFCKGQRCCCLVCS